MKFNRRFVLIALGTVAVATGVIFGSGAFTTVEADRTAEITVEDDSAAFLQIQANNPNFASTVDSGGADVVQIDLDAGSGGDGDGVNPDAYTQIENVINVTNQGTQEVTLDVTADEDGVNLVFDPVTLNEGDTSDVDIEVVTGDAEDEGFGQLPNNFDGQVTVTIEANAT